MYKMYSILVPIVEHLVLFYVVPGDIVTRLTSILVPIAAILHSGT